MAYPRNIFLYFSTKTHVVVFIRTPSPSNEYHNTFSWRNKKKKNAFLLKIVPYMKLHVWEFAVFVQNETTTAGMKLPPYPVSILYKSIAGRYRSVRVADGPITARYKFIKNARISKEIILRQSKLFSFLKQPPIANIFVPILFPLNMYIPHWQK